MERYIGIDVHAKSCTLAVIDSAGKRIGHHVVETNGQVLVNCLRTIPGERHVCIEEGTQSAWLFEILGPHAQEVIVANVTESRGQKSDERDALGLADKLRVGAHRLAQHAVDNERSYEDRLSSVTRRPNRSAATVVVIRANFPPTVLWAPFMLRDAAPKHWWVLSETFEQSTAIRIGPNSLELTQGEGALFPTGPTDFFRTAPPPLGQVTKRPRFPHHRDPCRCRRTGQRRYASISTEISMIRASRGSPRGPLDSPRWRCRELASE